MTALATTLAQKLVAHAAGLEHATPGEIVMCKADLAMSHDSSGPRRVAPMLESLGARVWDPKKFVVITDHYAPAVSRNDRGRRRPHTHFTPRKSQ